MKEAAIFRFRSVRFAIAVGATLLVTLILSSLGGSVNPTTVALSFLLVVLLVATFFGRNTALLASFVSMLCFNYFFLPPIGTWHIAEAQNLVAWAAFTITALIAGELSAYARRRARESEKLYEELQAAFTAATEAEALRQSEKLKSALLDAVTHDLRTPLTSIKASVTTLLDSEGGHRTIELDSNGRAEFLDIINEETDRLNGFIEGMVQLARLEAGTPEAEAAAASVDEIISTALDRASRILEGRNVTVKIEKDLPLLKVNARALAEVIYNLLDNAAKYSPAGQPIAVNTKRFGNKVMIEVEDRGEGIPPHLRDDVFKKFVRLASRSADGMGLGLAIARGIVEANNGTIEIRGDVDEKGTRVVVMLPADEEDDAS